MGKSLQVCEKLCPPIVKLFQNNVSHCKIVKTVTISSSTAHNVIKSSKNLEKMLHTWDRDRKCQ